MSGQPNSIHSFPPPASGSFADYFARQSAARGLTPDPAQQALAHRFDQLADSLGNNNSISLSKAIGRLLGQSKSPAPAIQGLYVWGDVGRGKSMVAGWFYDWLPTPAKRRVHFHAFMRDVHARMHAWRQLKATEDMLPKVVKEIGQGLRLLYLDEIQVQDVTDAMILSRLFSLLFEMGVMVVFTSNRAPWALYQSGLQREQFDKFVALLQSNVQVEELKSPHDYRLEQLRSMKQVYHLSGQGSAEWLYDAYCALTAGAESSPVALQVQGRQLLVEKAASGVAWMTFDELCERPLGAGDYLELASVFHTLLLQDIPALTSDKRNEAKRFVTLIDALYEQKAKLLCTAAALPEALYPKGDGQFEFQRTVSRLQEMQSEGYLASSHQKASQ